LLTLIGWNFVDFFASNKKLEKNHTCDFFFLIFDEHTCIFFHYKPPLALPLCVQMSNDDVVMLSSKEKESKYGDAKKDKRKATVEEVKDVGSEGEPSAAKRPRLEKDKQEDEKKEQNDAQVAAQTWLSSLREWDAKAISDWCRQWIESRGAGALLKYANAFLENAIGGATLLTLVSSHHHLSHPFLLCFLPLFCFAD